LRHKHDADVNINVNIPTQDLESLIDKATNSAVTIIAVFAAAQIVKAVFIPRSN
jgi:hypothetical protein